MSAILVVEDDPSVRELVRHMLNIEGHDVSLAADGRGALEAIDRRTFDLVITDLFMPERSGFETISDIRLRHPGLPILAISGGGRIGADASLQTARSLGANATLAKPFGHRDLVARVGNLLGSG
jgi:DNA-binding response OmpR family regulator